MRLLAVVSVALCVLAVAHALTTARKSDIDFRIPTSAELAHHYSATDRALQQIGEGLEKP